MIPKTKGSDVQLFVIQSVYKKTSKIFKTGDGEKIKDEFGKTMKVDDKKFVKESFCRVWFDKRELGPWGEYVGTKGQVAKSRTMVYNKSTQSYYTVAHSLEELEEVLHANLSIGYKTN